MEKNEEKQELQYTIVNHVAREAMNISVLEYCVFDSIYNLSSNPKSKGWCTASKMYLAEFLICSERTVKNALKKGIEEGLIERPEKRKNLQDNRLRTTQKWYDIAVMKKTGQILHNDRAKSAQSNANNRAKSAHNNNTTNKDINKDNTGSTEKKTNDTTENSCCSDDTKNQLRKEGITLTKLILESPGDKVSEALQRFMSSEGAHGPGKETAYFIGILKNVKTEVKEPIPDKFIDDQGRDEGAGLERAEDVYQAIDTLNFSEEDRDELTTIHCNMKWCAGIAGRLQEKVNRMLKIAGKYRVRELREAVI